MQKILMFFLSISLPLISSEQWNLTLCTIFQQEARFLEEWILFHEKEGVDHFILYNNLSTDNYQEVLAPFIQRGLVELIDWPSVPKDDEWTNFCFQVCVSAYNDAINRLRGKTKWLAIIDADEYLFSLHMPLKDLLKKYKKESAISFQWVCFGTSNVDYCKPGEALAKLVWRLPFEDPRNAWYKTISRMKLISHCTHPHACILKSGKERVLAREEARVNHYWTHDETFLHEVKVPRYQKWGHAYEHLIQSAAEFNQIYDDLITRARPSKI